MEVEPDPAVRALPSEIMMLHYSCDACKRPIDPQSGTRHIVRIEVFAAIEDDQPCGCDGGPDGSDDDDHLEEMRDLLERLDDVGDGMENETRSMRFDLCDDCRRRFVRNPLGIRKGKQLGFSQN